jgi:hypothetical protein
VRIDAEVVVERDVLLEDDHNVLKVCLCASEIRTVSASDREQDGAERAGENPEEKPGPFHCYSTSFRHNRVVTDSQLYGEFGTEPEFSRIQCRTT